MHMTMLLNRSDGRLDELALIGSEPFSMQWTNELRRNVGLHPSCAQLVSDFGIPVTRTNNGSPARKKDEFANADAEKWFAFRRLLEKREVILPVDGELLKQLSSRRLQYDAKARIQLEPKELMRARGLPSPDRADAVIGAAVQGLPGFRSGAITSSDLDRIKFGGARLLFDPEPLLFD
jgi:hypothetical protein